MIVNSIVIYPGEVISVSGKEGTTNKLFLACSVPCDQSNDVDLLSNNKKLCTLKSKGQGCSIENIKIGTTPKDFSTSSNLTPVRLFIVSSEKETLSIVRKVPKVRMMIPFEKISASIAKKAETCVSNKHSLIEMSILVSSFISVSFIDNRYLVVGDELKNSIVEFLKKIDVKEQLDMFLKAVSAKLSHNGSFGFAYFLITFVT